MTNKTTEALKLAEEALKSCEAGNWSMSYDELAVDEALAAIREVRAEQEKQDVRCECCGYMTHHREHMGCIRAAYAAPVSAPKQEPVAYLVTGPYEKHAFADIGSAEAYCRGLNKGFGDAAYSVSPLYAAPESVEAAVLAEREACAKVCEERGWEFVDPIRECAAAIRARSDK